MKILDVSIKSLIVGAKHWTAPIDQLYHPTGELGSDSQDIVYSNRQVTSTKFYPILLKEWGFLVEKDGYLVVDYASNDLCDAATLEKTFRWLWGDTYEIYSHHVIKGKDKKITSVKQLNEILVNTSRELSSDIFSLSGGTPLRFIARKKKSTKIDGDSIQKWTFGIITNGKRKDWLDKIIASIREQKIPHYEIIICGTYSNREEEDVRYIPFAQRDDIGWITKKKNIIVENANYENICLMHDRMVLDNNWYNGMRKWGNTFEILGCQQLYKGERVNDWIAQHNILYKGGKEYFSLASYVDYKDWYLSSWLLGQLYILKKHLPIKLNENLYYGQQEDYAFAKSLQSAGILTRLNPYSIVHTLTHKYLTPSYIEFSTTSEKPTMLLSGNTSWLKYLTYTLLRTTNIFGLYPSSHFLAKASEKVYRLVLSFTPQKKKDSEESARTSG